MLASWDGVLIMQVFFMMTTALFVITTIIVLSRSRQLKKKISDMLEQLAGKNKELDEAKAASQNILSPFIPETSRSIIISIDTDGKITDMNDYAVEVFGFTKEELLGKEVLGTILPISTQKDSKAPNMIERIFSNPKLYVEYETEHVRKNGEHFWVSWTNRVMYDDAGSPVELRSVGFDITKRKRLEEELKYLASVDPQTGALNRQALLEAGMHELKRAQRYKRQLSILIMKLDYFHGTDDTHGFSDDILRQVVSIVRATTRDSDFIGRVGDVEFALILPETSKEDAFIVAERIKEKIQEENLKHGGSFFVTVGFGVAEKAKASDTIDTLLLTALNSVDNGEQKESKRKKKGR